MSGQILLVCLPDPTDIVVQGWSPLSELAYPKDNPACNVPLSLVQLVAGDEILSYLPSNFIPAALVGQSDWYGIKPRQIGPMVMDGGEVVMHTIGIVPLTYKDLLVDPIQQFLNSANMLDSTGANMTLYDSEIIGQLPVFDDDMILAEPQFPPDPTATIPPRELLSSGLLKRTTSVILPDSFGRHTMMEDFVDTTQKWFISGVTKDGTGTPIVSCKVLVMLTDKVTISIDQYANPIVADIVSNPADGTYLVQVGTNNLYWLIAYKTGPDKAGSTIKSVVPTSG